MYFLDIGKRAHLLLEDHLFLIAANWGPKLYLLYRNETVSKSTFNEGSLVCSGKGFHWFCAARQDLYASKPQGTIVGMSQQATHYKFIQWAFSFYRINVSDSVLRAMTSRSLDEQGYAAFPDPLQVLRLDWSQSVPDDPKSWTQRGVHEADGEMYLRVAAAGWLTTLPDHKDLDLSGISVLGIIERGALEQQLLQPYLAQQAKIRKLQSA